MYKSTTLLTQNLTEKDRQNIAALIVDPKYHSLIKLQANLKTQSLQQIFHKKVVGDQELLNRGGVMMLSMLERTVEDQFRQRYANMAQDKAEKETLNGLGW